MHINALQFGLSVCSLAFRTSVGWCSRLSSLNFLVGFGFRRALGLESRLPCWCRCCLASFHRVRVGLLVFWSSIVTLMLVPTWLFFALRLGDEALFWGGEHSFVGACGGQLAARCIIGLARRVSTQHHRKQEHVPPPPPPRHPRRRSPRRSLREKSTSAAPLAARTCPTHRMARLNINSNLMTAILVTHSTCSAHNRAILQTSCVHVSISNVSCSPDLDFCHGVSRGSDKRSDLSIV